MDMAYSDKFELFTTETFCCKLALTGNPTRQSDYIIKESEGIET